MENNKNTSQESCKIYDELKGYFPAEYDLTPDELEKEIELENKKREIALGMMRTHLTEEKSEISETDVIPVKPEVKPAEAASNLSDEPDAGIEEPSVTKADLSYAEEPVSVYEETELSDNESAVITDEDYLNAYAPLDELFSTMENNDPEKLKDEENARKTVSWFFDFLEVFSICIACIIVIFAFFFRLTKVSGESMENTLFENEYLVVSDLFYEPQYGDIVVIQNTSLKNELLREPLVKRVIAVGGQTVTIKHSGVVTVTYEDGTTKVLEEDYIKEQNYSGLTGQYEVPEGHVFVMGDNRNHSTDSRSPLVGVIDERCIFGKAYMRVLPFNAFTIFENPDKD